MKVLITFILFVTALNAFGQREYFIQDGATESPIPFAKVYPNVGDPFLTDLDGRFEVSEGVSSVQIRYSGYSDTVVTLADVTDKIIYLLEDVQRLDEVVVTPGVNPAHRIINEVIRNRKKNHPVGDMAFEYTSYSKFKFDANPAAIEAIPDNTTDSNLISMKEFFSKQHLFMIENASKRNFTPPYRDKEEILAYKVSGFTNPMLSTLVSSLQSFSFYDTKFELFGNTYINPIALGGTKRYIFVLKDTTYVGNDTTFTIYYQPRKDKEFDGLKGNLYINTNGYAIEKVTAAPFKEDGNELEIIQEYAFVDGKKWFPKKLSTSMKLKGILQIEGVDDDYLTGTGTTYIKELKLDPPEQKKGYNDNYVLVTDPDAEGLESENWQGLREYELTEKEQMTYKFLDSLSKAENLDAKLGMFSSVVKGQIPVWKLELPIDQLFGYNLYEKFRLGLGVYTSDRLMKNFRFGGYFAYGFGDKAWKWGGESKVMFSHKRNFFLRMRYNEDVVERGGNQFDINAAAFLDPSTMRELYISNMDRERLAQVALQVDVKANFTIQLGGNYRRLWYTQGYGFRPDTSFNFNAKTDVVETYAEFYWSPFEKYMLLGDQKFQVESKYPKFRFRVAKGWDTWLTGEYDYLRLSASVSQRLKFNFLGSLDYALTAQKTTGTVPMALNHVANGTYTKWAISVTNSFETVAPGRFYHDEQVALFLRYNFPAIKTKSAWTEPQFSVHHAIGFGNMRNAGIHQLEFDTMDKGYSEVGVILNGLLTSGSTALGVGGFYNYGAYSDKDWKKNIYPKIAVGFIF
ncbi:MAG: DUF5686 family protein [Crocinitomicaceae bacterium]